MAGRYTLQHCYYEDAMSADWHCADLAVVNMGYTLWWFTWTAGGLDGSSH